MNEILLCKEVITPSNDNNKNDYVLVVKRKIEKYIISFTILHNHSSITSDLSKLKSYCDKLQNYSCDSIWIVK